MSSLRRRSVAAVALASLIAGGAAAQILGGGGPIGGISLPPVNLPVGQVPVVGEVLNPVLGQRLSSTEAREAVRPTLDSVGGLPSALAEAGPATLSELRRIRLRELIRANSRQLENDGQGQPVRRGVVIVADPDPGSLQVALRAGFRLVGDDREAELGLRSITLAVPRGDNAREGLRKLARIAPSLHADFDHVYEPAGGKLAPVAGSALAAMTAAANGRRIGMIDGGVSAHPSLAWMVRKRAPVVNVSLAGPPNRIVQRAIEAVRARGVTIVAAVGNDGPAAPPQYPASYPGVIAVTGVDARGRALPEAGRSTHLDFAAPGADMAAASPGQGFAKVRGTSFAAPLAASRLSVSGSVAALAAEARPGRGKVGRGIVCATCRTDPKAVRAK